LVLARLFSSANRSIYAMVYLITLDEISDALVEAARRGVSVKLLVEAENVDIKGSDVVALARAGIDVRVDTNKYLMHHKVAVVDERVVVTGSMNWSYSGSQRNNENILIIESRELARVYLEEFLLLWETASPLD
jgi:phosphatidylserine/phosphatidylglycerophosphate/cardiolipin synthase-like enzyme